MTEETFGLAAMILIAILGCGFGFFVLFIEQIDRWMERMKRKRA